jgi:hypothetical protein
MNNLSGDTITLSQLVRTEEQGLNVNRLLFAKFLVMTGRINEGDLSKQHTISSIPEIYETVDDVLTTTPSTETKEIPAAH